MFCAPDSPFLQRLRGRITLAEIPFSDAGSRLLLFRNSAGLYIRLAERWYKWEAEVGNYRARRPMIEELVFTDAAGAELPYELTSYPHALCFQTPLGRFSLAFIDEESIYLQLPVGRTGISFRVLSTQVRTDRRGGESKGDPEHRRTHRNVAYTTNARILAQAVASENDGFSRVQCKFAAEEGDGLVLNITPRLGLNRSVPQGEDVFRAAETRWHAWFAQVPPVDESLTNQYYYAWWILRAGLLSPRFFLTHEAMMPSMIHYVGVWAWDAYFHALAYRYVDRTLAENQLRILLDHQREDGMIPDAVHDEGTVNRLPLPSGGNEVDVTKPPLIAWTVYKLFQTSGHQDFLDEVYEPLVRNCRWWFERNDDDRDGIAQYNHPNSSGLDDNPLWDEGMPVESPDLNTYLVLELEALARIARVIGLEEQATQWEARAGALTQKMIDHFWDPDAGVFWAMRDHKRIPVLTPFNLYPLITGRLPRELTERLVQHLLSSEFWTLFPIPTVATSDPLFDPVQMWRGPTWVNVNYLFMEGLVRCGYADVARDLRDRTLNLLTRHGDIYEYYNPETGQPSPKAASVFGWSSALFVDLAIKASRGEIV